MKWFACIVAILVAGFSCKPKERSARDENASSGIPLKPVEPGIVFQFPTANRELLKPGGETNFFTRTNPARPPSSGAFGCVRNSRTRMHEGIDIAAQQRDANGESTDPVQASRAGKVVYINKNVAASNYGRYVVMTHELQGLPVYTLYAHLRSVREDLKVGGLLSAGEPLGVLGRSANTRDGISKARAHLHFEIGVQFNTRFNSWFKHWYKDGNNFHGPWNGVNLAGLDAAAILRSADAGKFDIKKHLSEQPILCRVEVFQAELDWAERYPELVADSGAMGSVPVLSWELSLNFNAIPVALKPIRERRNSAGAKYRLLEVDENVRAEHPCSGLVFKRGARWTFTSKGQRVMDLLIFR
jgi:murein DD-endopeptidase MepM/ murein hydrolase activator NlpD